MQARHLDEQTAIGHADRDAAAVPQPHVQPREARLAVDGEEVQVAACEGSGTSACERVEVPASKCTPESTVRCAAGTTMTSICTGPDRCRLIACKPLIHIQNFAD